MGRVSVIFLVFLSLCATALAGSVSRSSAYSGYGYGKQAPPVVAANGRQGGRGYSGGSASEALKSSDQVKGATPDKKTGGSGVSAWGIIAIILTVCLSLMGVYYFTIFYPILCRKERKYDVMELGSQ